MVLPRRQVHAGIWFRLLRAIIDELSCPLSESRPSDADTIRHVWETAGYPPRDGQSHWRPYEQQTETVQQHTMEATAMAIALLEKGSITGGGENVELFQPVPESPISDGTPPRPPAPKIGEQHSLIDAFNAAVNEAQINPAAARTLFNMATYKQNDADKIHDLVNVFIELNIPLDFHHAT